MWVLSEYVKIGPFWKKKKKTWNGWHQTPRSRGMKTEEAGGAIKTMASWKRGQRDTGIKGGRGQCHLYHVRELWETDACSLGQRATMS